MVLSSNDMKTRCANDFNRYGACSILFELTSYDADFSQGILDTVAFEGYKATLNDLEDLAASVEAWNRCRDDPVFGIVVHLHFLQRTLERRRRTYNLRRPSSPCEQGMRYYRLSSRALFCPSCFSSTFSHSTFLTRYFPVRSIFKSGIPSPSESWINGRGKSGSFRRVIVTSAF